MLRCSVTIGVKGVLELVIVAKLPRKGQHAIALVNG